MKEESGMDDHSVKVVDFRTINILEYLVVVAKYKKLILRVVGATMLASVILFFLVLPRWYKSVATVMPPKQKNSLSLLSTLSKAAAPLRSLGIGAASEELSQFITILTSRRLSEAVIQKFDLQQVYDLENMEKTVKELEENTEFALGKEDVSVEITVYDTEPDRAAAMANYFVQMLNEVYQQMSVAEAKSNREFIEKRYLVNLEDLKKAEESFKAFQQKYHVYSVPDQVKGAVEAAAAIQSRIAVKEVQLGLLKKTTTPDNTLQEAVIAELRELRKQLESMKAGDMTDKSGFKIFAPFDKAPEIGIEYLRQYRELELQGKILELILPLYEEAKIEEQRDTPAVIALDSAVPAVKHAKPKRLTFTLLLTLASVFVSIVVSLFLDRYRRGKVTRTAEEEAKLALIKEELRFRNLFR